MCIAKGMVINVHEYDMVEGETLSEMELGLCLEDVYRKCERCRLGDKSIHCLVKFPINKLVDRKGEILKVKKKFKDPLKEMVLWDIIEDTSPLKKWDEHIYSEKYIESIDMHVMRPYKRIK